MDNELYKMMIKNAREHIDSQSPNGKSPDEFDIWEISSVLSMVLAKDKQKIILDIIELHFK